MYKYNTNVKRFGLKNNHRFLEIRPIYSTRVTLVPEQFCSNNIRDVKILDVLVVVPENGSNGVDVRGCGCWKTDA